MYLLHLKAAHINGCQTRLCWTFDGFKCEEVEHGDAFKASGSPPKSRLDVGMRGLSKDKTQAESLDEAHSLLPLDSPRAQLPLHVILARLLLRFLHLSCLSCLSLASAAFSIRTCRLTCLCRHHPGSASKMSSFICFLFLLFPPLSICCSSSSFVSSHLLLFPLRFLILFFSLHSAFRLGPFHHPSTFLVFPSVPIDQSFSRLVQDGLR